MAMKLKGKEVELKAIGMWNQLDLVVSKVNERNNFSGYSAGESGCINLR